MGEKPSAILLAGALPFGRAPQKGIGNALLGAVGAWLVGASVAIAAVIGPAMPSPTLRAISAAGIDLSRVRTAPSDEIPDALPDTEQLASLGPGWGVHLAAMPVRHQRALLRAVAQRASSMTLDVAPLSDGVMPTKKQLFQLGMASDAIIIGHREAEGLWPGRSPRDVLRILANRGASTAVMRMGGGAALGISNATVSWMPGLADIEQALTPATDAYGGAFAAAYARNRDLSEAMAWAGATAAAVAQTGDPLELMNPYARRSVEASATVLRHQSMQTD